MVGEMHRWVVLSQAGTHTWTAEPTAHLGCTPVRPLPGRRGSSALPNAQTLS